jgi:glycosyltransferase involved in cell wall biosynthesis
MPTISVIVPVYNVEQYLCKCLDSILNQIFTDFELLLIDDGSPDKSGQICDEYAHKDSRIRVFHKENGGVSSARNLGLDNANGKWVTFIDSDC